MSKLMVRGALFALVLLPANVLVAATYIVPTDRDMVRRANAIVIGEALASYTQMNGKGGVETVTPFSISEVLKGRVDDDTINIFEPGGKYKEQITSIPGVPRFTEGEKVILFLAKTGARRWSVTDLALGRFSFATDRAGRSVAVRAENDIVGWEPSGDAHKEVRRSADGFIEFIRAEASGGVGKTDYVVPFEPLQSDPTASKKNRAAPLTTYSAATYTSDPSADGKGIRWSSFPTAISFKTQSGVSATAVTATQTALSTWTNAAGANVNYTYGGSDNCVGGCVGLAGGDGVNEVLFERNLVGYVGVGPFTCNANSYGGLLGLGGASNTGATYTFNGETFYAMVEGDVEMNQGVLGCVGTSPFTTTNLAVAVTHELGHTLGFRHSDQTRANNPSVACSTDATLECDTTSAVMKSFIPSGATGLGTYDMHAVTTVYPAPSISAPTNVVATAASATSVGISWTASSGATSYEVARSADRTNFTTVCTTAATSCTDSTASASTAYLYKVRAVAPSASSYSSSDLATTVVFTDPTLTAGVTQVKAAHITELRTAIDAVRKLANNGVSNPGTYTDTITATSTGVKAVHITELRTAITTARSTLGLSAASFTNASITATTSTIQAVDFTDLRNAVK